jgi:hypothetical protein
MPGKQRRFFAALQQGMPRSLLKLNPLILQRSITVAA